MKKASLVWMIIIFILLAMIVVLLYLFIFRKPQQPSATVNRNQANTNVVVTANAANTNTNAEASVCGLTGLKSFTSGKEVLTNNSFEDGADGWQGHTYFSTTTTDDQYDQLSVEDGVVTFTADESDPVSTRYGLLQVVNLDVRNTDSITLSARVQANESSLGGTGQQGREAPVAVGVVYYDQDCVLHSGLPEDPKQGLATRMFWRGFYYQEPTGSEVSSFGTKTEPSEWLEYSIDLKQFNPQVITVVGVEGAGWKPRSGSVAEISLVVE